MNDKEIYLKLPDEIVNYMEENEIELSNYLMNENINGNFKNKYLNQDDDGVRGKSLLTTIIGSGISISAVILAVNKLIQTIQTKPILVWIKKYDSKGRAVEKPILIEPSKYKNETYFKADFSENEKICIEFGSKDE